MRVRLRRDGRVLYVMTLTRRLVEILGPLLSYDRVVQLRGWEARQAHSNVRIEGVACYQVVRDPDKVIKPYLVAPLGYWDRVVSTLKAEGYKLVLERDELPSGRAYKPEWDVLEDFKFRYKQRHVLEQMARKSFGIISCCPGYGKTMLIKLFCQLFPYAKIDITTASLDVIQDIYAELSQVIPLVGLVTGGKKRAGNRVTCYSGKSLHHSEGDADVLLVDEFHEWGTPDFLRRLTRYPKARKFGFSGNLNDRQDKSDFELEGVFGPVIAEVSYQEAVAHNCVVPIEVHWRDVVMDYNPAEGLSGVDKDRAGLWQNEYRNKLIAEDARELAKTNQQVLVMVNTIEHAMFIKKELPEFTLCYSENGLDKDCRDNYIEWGLIKPSEPIMTRDRRDKLKRAFADVRLRRVIANGVWKRGVDFKSLTALIRGDGGSSAINDLQIPGRTSRLHLPSGKEAGIVRDYLDQFDLGYRRKAQDRKRHYKRYGWQQVMPSRGKSQFLQAYLDMEY